MGFRRRFEDELDDEMRFHLESQIEDYIKAGMTPAEARRRALAEFGGVDRAKEECRELHPLAFAATILQDLRYGARMLARSPGFTAVAVLCLAIGIGVNTAVFSAVDTVWLRPLAVPHSSELVWLQLASKNNPRGFSYPEFRDYREHAKSIVDLVATSGHGAIFSGDGWRDVVMVESVSDNFLTALGVPLALGRGFREEPNAPPSVVISHRYFLQRFGGDPNVIGRVIDSHGTVVSGVTAPEFRGTNSLIAISAWIPGRVRGDSIADRDNGDLQLIGRLKPGTTMASAQQEVAAIAANLAREYPKTNKGTTVQLTSDYERRYKSFGVLLVMPLVSVILLLAAANVAMLLLARAEVRRHETSIRLAIGAGRLRLMRQFLTESLLLAAGGGALGVALAAWLVRVLMAMIPADVRQFGMEWHLDARALVFTLGVSLCSVVAFGLLPAFTAARSSVTEGLKDSVAGGRPRVFSLRNVLVVVQVAVSIAFAFLGVLLAKSFYNAAHTELGLARKQVLVLSVAAPSYAGTERAAAFVRDLTEQVRALPGVENATVATRCPFSLMGGGRRSRILALDTKQHQPDTLPEIRTESVGPEYFAVLGQPIVRGRAFSQRDEYGGPKVAIVNESAARRYWPGEDPIGKRLRTNSADGPLWTIVGVAHDARDASPTEDPAPLLYQPYLQGGGGDMTLMVETRTAPLSLIDPIRKRLRAIDREATIFMPSTLTSIIDTGLSPQRIAAQMTGALAAMGMLLAVIGLYGVVSYFANRRRREVGILMALGATRGMIMAKVLRHGAWLVVVGGVLGIALAIPTAVALGSALYGVKAGDPLALAAAVIATVLAGLAASGVPALRASRVDPVIALRQE